MLSTIPSLTVALVAAVLSVLTPPRLSPTERAKIVIRHAFLAGTGAPIARADVIAELAAERPPSLPVTDPEPVTPDPGRITPDAQPDEPVSIEAAAERLGVSISTVRRYMAPSSGRLIRSSDGVTQASLEACAATR